MNTNVILHGDALTMLRTLPDESIDCVMTSPPYWGLRDYGHDDQLGLEPDFRDYISNLCDIFDEVKRVLKKTGTCWVNLGDSYASGKQGRDDYGDATSGLNNSKRYYFEQQFEPLTAGSADRYKYDFTGSDTHFEGKKSQKAVEGSRETPDKRNKRAVWKISPKPYSEAHFAVYPPELCETPIKAGCPEGGVVLDPFFGSGTTGLVAEKLNRRWIGIELNEDYIEIANKRLAQQGLGV